MQNVPKSANSIPWKFQRWKQPASLQKIYAGLLLAVETNENQISLEQTGMFISALGELCTTSGTQNVHHILISIQISPMLSNW